MTVLVEFLRVIVFVLSLADCYKYRFINQHLKELKSSKGVSRKFVNISFLYRVFLFVYSTFILKDWVISVSCVIAIFAIVETGWLVYLYYPYKYRGLKNFKRPNIFVYLWNSILPNKIRKRL